MVLAAGMESGTKLVDDRDIALPDSLELFVVGRVDEGAFVEAVVVTVVGPEASAVEGEEPFGLNIPDMAPIKEEAI